jgi:redox-sensing transcriptional repressor
MPHNQIPDIVVGRLPQYLRSLQRMSREGRQITSSKELGERLGISAAQIRKDLSQFGEFGKQGTGYSIAYLLEQLQIILNIDTDWDVAVVGIGGIGSAIVRYKGFTNRGFKIRMIFDSDPEKIGTSIENLVIQDTQSMTEAVRDAGIKIAMLAVPADQAQGVANQLVEAGVRAFLCYAPISLNLPQGVRIQYIDPSLHMQRMTYYLK